jgi:transposase
MDVEALKALILSQQQQLHAKDEQLLSRDHEIEHLKLLIAKLQRMQFGRRSEKVGRQIEQLELRLEELETSRTRAGTRTSTRLRTAFHLPAHDIREEAVAASAS